jgi:hypothetical protein
MAAGNLLQANSNNVVGIANNILTLTSVGANNFLYTYCEVASSSGVGAPIAPNDSTGQTWTRVWSAPGAVSNTVGFASYYLLNAQAGTHTITWYTASGGVVTPTGSWAAAAEFSGPIYGQDRKAFYTSGSQTANNTSFGYFNNCQANSLIISILGIYSNNSSQNVLMNSGATLVLQPVAVSNNGSVSYSTGGVFFANVGSTTDLIAKGSWTSSNAYQLMFTSFRTIAATSGPLQWLANSDITQYTTGNSIVTLTDVQQGSTLLGICWNYVYANAIFVANSTLMPTGTGVFTQLLSQNSSSSGINTRTLSYAYLPNVPAGTHTIDFKSANATTATFNQFAIMEVAAAPISNPLDGYSANIQFAPGTSVGNVTTGNWTTTTSNTTIVSFILDANTAGQNFSANTGDRYLWSPFNIAGGYYGAQWRTQPIASSTTKSVWGSSGGATDWIISVGIAFKPTTYTFSTNLGGFFIVFGA